ncbi:HAMP domain-containing histidine kinase [Tractidigestivibacter sp. KD21]|uniref:histidine kinase n=2 Tax=Atopobiaceae TaxID=1643824 RepID=A0ABT1Z6Q4_9ACTN|nr:HAMP domain-containing sensor histidine kinase [Tractidigestivibacter montrealensis]MCR9035888.1 HAMP domain-containing histidine kinase [Tractidigestivibacter montrealensis]
MAISFALTAVMTAAIFVMVLAVVWESQFKAYTRSNMQSLAQSAADTLAIGYDAAGAWTPEVIANASSISVSSPDVSLQVLDEDGNVLYDDSVDASHHGDSGVNTGTTAVPTASESVVTASVVDAKGKTVGTVRLWAFGSDALLTSSDAKFRESSYSAIAAAAAIAVVLAVIIGYFVSRSLTKPIQRITRTASQIRNGDLTARTGVRGTDEIGQLGETFDDMATSLEKDLKLEHRLTSDVAHELRTPLMAILATVEAMQDGVLPADDEHLETLASETRRLSRLVDAMLKLSRLENGTTELKIERTDVVYLVKSLVSSQHQLFHEKGLHLRFKDDTAHGECQADVDPDLIREAVVNLMSNAMRYTDEDGWVVVSVSSDHSDAIISVRDTGIGIAKEDIPQTFSRFWRSDVSRERVSGGLGVGLSITKEIVDRHNGTISVDSELGKGTTFTIRVPLNRGRRNLKQALQEKQQEK